MQTENCIHIVFTAGLSMIVEQSKKAALRKAYSLSINAKSLADSPKYIFCPDTNEWIDAFGIKSLWTEIGLEKSCKAL